MILLWSYRARQAPRTPKKSPLLAKRPRMNDVSLVSADSVPLEVVWRAFVDGFRGYVVPVELSFDEFEQVIADEKISLAASVVAVRHGVEPCGAAMLAIRTAESWCGGLGVVPSVRRTGLGRRMMLAIIKEARTRGVTRMRLECIDGNHAAWSLYEGIGFRPTRRLESFRGAATPRPDAWKAASIWPLGDPGLVWNRFAAYHPVPPAWQTDLPVLRRQNPNGCWAGQSATLNAHVATYCFARSAISCGSSTVAPAYRNRLPITWRCSSRHWSSPTRGVT